MKFYSKKVLKALKGAFAIGTYPLKNSVILDSGNVIHVFNNKERFLEIRPSIKNDIMYAGDTLTRIQGYGRVNITINTP